MLELYLSRTRSLLQNPQAPVELYQRDNLVDWINQARVQTAGEGECIRVLGTIPTVVDQRNYNFTDINVGVSATNGVAGPLNVRSLMYNIGDGQQWVAPRGWPWFQLYCMNNVVPEAGLPSQWSQYAQGSTGSFYIDPPPDIVYTLTLDCVCYPIPLVDDTTVEALPPLWTDSVSYFAAYLALLSAQTGARANEANMMFERYKEFVSRARTFSNPSVDRFQYEQATDPTQVAKLGLSKTQAGGG